MNQINTKVRFNPDRICQDPKCSVCVTMDIVAASCRHGRAPNLDEWRRTHDATTNAKPKEKEAIIEIL